MKLASIGPETTKAITALRLKATVEGKEHTIVGLVKAIEARSVAKRGGVAVWQSESAGLPPLSLCLGHASCPPL